MPESCLEIKGWETPASNYLPTKVGNVELVQEKQKGGVYFMEGVRGYDYYHHKKPIQITCLNIDGETVMVDDPLHWYGMQDLAKACTGKVLIGGLGALQDNKEVTSIHVIEKNQDVVET